MNNRAVIISGGTLELQVVKEQLQDNDYIIGVDKGVEFLHQHQINMDAIVGDFDSVSIEIIEKYKEENKIPIQEFNPVKDASDTEMAVRFAMELGYKELVILGATGSRLDHVWANIQVLSIPYKENVKAYIVDATNKISLLEKDEVIRKEEMYGEYFSVFSLGSQVENLTISGAKYPLENHCLLPYDSLSVSNEVVEDILKITYKSGILIFMESKEA